MKVKTIITDSMIKHHTICNNVLRHTCESGEAKLERLLDLCTKIANVQIVG